MNIVPSKRKSGKKDDFASPLRDSCIRQALVSKRLRKHLSQPDTLLIHELGLAHAKNRIDVATVNGAIHGFEIKSERDSLDRLPGQLETYCQTLQKLTLVVADRHVDEALDMVPNWVGVWKVSTGPRGGVRFKVCQEGRRNPDVDLFLLAHLLWRDEAQSYLAKQGAAAKDLRAPRAELYRQLVEDVTEQQLVALIKSSMMQRRAWRDHLRPS